MNLIVIEDDENFASLVAKSLEGLVDNVSVFSDWDNAFSTVQNTTGDIAWVDLRMPTSSERQTIDRIAKLRSTHQDIVIIVGSGYITPEIRASLDRAGIDGCYYKGGKYTPEQVGSLIVLGLMRASKRNPNTMNAMLNKAMEWFHKKFPEASIT